MAHFATAHVKKSRVVVLTRPHAIVMVEVVKQRPTPVLVLAGGVEIAQWDTQWVEVPPGTVIQTPDGDTIEPSGTFYVSVETFDPYHAVMDVTQEGVFHW